MGPLEEARMLLQQERAINSLAVENAGRLLTRIAELEAEARRYYRADGTHEVLDSAAEVVERRKAAAALLDEQSAAIERLADRVQTLTTQRDRAVAERDALLEWCVVPAKPPFEGRWFVPGFGFREGDDDRIIFASKEDAFAAIRAAASDLAGSPTTTAGEEAERGS